MVTASVSDDDRKATEVKATALAATVAGIALGALIGPAAAHADPLNPRDPDYCGNKEDILFCTSHLSTYPNAGESAYLTDIRGWFPPGTEAHRLAIGRAACLEFPTHPRSLVVDQTAVYLQIPRETAERVVDSANTNICPNVHPQP